MSNIEQTLSIIKPDAVEIMVNGSKHKIIRKRQSLENLINN